MRYLWLALAFLVAVGGVLAGLRLGLSREATVTLTLIPMFLVMFPFMKQWMPKAKFAHWALLVVIGAAVTWLLFLVFSRFGG